MLLKRIFLTFHSLGTRSGIFKKISVVRLKKIQTLYQSIQLLSQQIQAKEQEVTQKLQADQAESVQKVVNELIKAKKIKMLLNSQALLAFDRSDEKINITPEVVDLINKDQKK